MVKAIRSYPVETWCELLVTSGRHLARFAVMLKRKSHVSYLQQSPLTKECTCVKPKFCYIFIVRRLISYLVFDKF